MNFINKKARYEYELLDKYEAGVVLTGPEVKSVRLGHISFSDSYVSIRSGECWLINLQISPYTFANMDEYDPKRSRKLLLHKRQLLSLQKKMETTNLTLVPTRIYTAGRRIKVEISLARGKKQYQKKEQKRRRDLDRDAERALQSRI